MRRKQVKREIKYSVGTILLVVLILAVVLIIQTHQLKTKSKEYAVTQERLQSQIQDEYEKKASIEEYEKYTQTKKYVEDVAREKLGLVYPDEIIIQGK